MHPLKKPQTHSPCWFLSQTQANDHLRIGIARVEMHPKCLFPAAVYQCTGWQMTNHEPYVFFGLMNSPIILLQVLEPNKDQCLSYPINILS